MRLRSRLFAPWLVVGFGLTALACFSVLALCVPIDAWLFNTLQDRFSPPKRLERVDGIVVLGGGGIGRMRIPLELASRFPSAKIVLTGGGGLNEGGYTEVRLVRNLMVQSGLDQSRLLVDEKAKNTYENAVFSYRTATPRPNEVWVLVTSAYHMPRAVGCFRKMNWSVIPYPVDQKAPEYIVAVREWLGLLTYYLSGRTSALLPGP